MDRNYAQTNNSCVHYVTNKFPCIFMEHMTNYDLLPMAQFSDTHMNTRNYMWMNMFPLLSERDIIPFWNSETLLLNIYEGLPSLQADNTVIFVE